MISRELRKRVKQIMGSTLAFAVVGYFIYHVVQGDRGLLAMLRFLKSIEESREVLIKIEAEQNELANRVRLLKPESLNRDMLDEQIRRQLGFIQSDEIVILLDAVKPQVSP